MAKQKIITSTPGKLILLGEYAVLEQAPALVAAVSRTSKISVTTRLDSVFELEMPNLDLPNIPFIFDENGKIHLLKNTREQLNGHGLVISVLEYMQAKSEEAFPPATIKIDTSDFYHEDSGFKFGLGSSAAMTVGLIRAMNELTSKPIASSDLYREAFEAHRWAQGKMGSGVDIAASANGGILSYRMPDNQNLETAQIENLEWPEELLMMCIWTGSSASTTEMLKKVDASKEANSASYWKIMAQMIELAENGEQAFREKDAEAFLEIVEDYYRIEEQLGNESGAKIISQSHRKCHELVTQTGGAYKPSGAGGGDIGIAFCTDMDTCNRIFENITRSSFEVLNFSVQQNDISKKSLHESL